MYLSRLEMVGFKSFALKTDLSFNDGVTAIVGPNGCGKTNIVDAIRWVLGEQKTSMLRADSMEHVIFNGSKTRKPLGMSEVSLTIENNRQILPTEYAQVVITRRLFRDGESQYLLNKTQCRLRDIVDLFMDTGMGADAYSVIELKMIETILSDKADERRHLFEEAAGVTKYKARRKEAQRKLEAAQRDIARVQDIVREVQKTVNSLSRQAEKARQHQELSARLRELERLHLAFEYAEEFVALKQFEARIADIRTRRETAEQLMNQYETAVREKELAYESAEIELRNAIEAETNARLAVDAAKQQATLLEERINSNVRTLERLEREQVESAQQQTSTSDELVRVQERLVEITAQHESHVNEASMRQEKHEASVAALQMAKSELDSSRDALTVAQHELSQQRTLADRYRIQSEAFQRRLADNEAQQLQLADKVAQVELHIATERENLSAHDSLLTTAEEKLHAAENKQTELRTENEKLQTEVVQLQSSLAHNNASLEFLSSLVDTTESSKFLLSTTEWNPSGEKLTLAEVINAPEELRVAIEAALGDAARYFVVADKSEANQAIKALSKNNVGKATFLCRDSIPSIGQPPSIERSNDVVGWASELVACDDQLRMAVRGILGKTVVVTSVDAAWQMMQSGMTDSAVTLAGEIVHRSGAIRGGAHTQTEGVRLGRKERIERLQADIEQLRASIGSTENRIDAIKSELAGIDLRAIADEVRRTAVERNEVQQRIEASNGRIEDLRSQRSTLQGEAEVWTREQQEVHQGAIAAENSVSTLGAGIVALESNVQEKLRSVQAAEEHVAQANAELNAANIMVVRTDGERRSLEANARRLADQNLTIAQRTDQRDAERLELQNSRVEFESQRNAVIASVDNLAEQHQGARDERVRLDAFVKECLNASHESAELVRQHRKTVETVVSEGHETDLKHHELKLRMEMLVRRAVDELEMELPEEPQPPQIEQTAEEVHADVMEARRRLTSMGNVNFLALEEHQREDERLQFLTKQLDDLVTSERTLTETIAEINRTARDKFTSTFDKIRTNFIELFKVLFSEDDEADLQMIETEDNDPLECKIDIMAKPRGKRPHNIEMLSGGEKTLTAIALLFAIYLVKPSPFCILDEVDAPLDDANIDRYLKIIRKFSENTQFLMITHNKRTMEAADTLYGVTMEEPAVSKVVSVQIAGERSAA